MEETNRVHCRECGELKIKTECGVYANGRNKKYSDQMGKLWSGKTCPDCHRNRSRELMKNHRAKSV